MLQSLRTEPVAVELGPDQFMLLEIKFAHSDDDTPKREIRAPLGDPWVEPVVVIVVEAKLLRISLYAGDRLVLLRRLILHQKRCIVAVQGVGELAEKNLAMRSGRLPPDRRCRPDPRKLQKRWRSASSRSSSDQDIQLQSRRGS